jgi:hypothetical protein
MRAWAVDLAGNVRPHGGEAFMPGPDDGSDDLARALDERSSSLDASRRIPVELRSTTRAALQQRREMSSSEVADDTDAIFADREHEAIVRVRQAERRPAGQPVASSVAADRRSVVREALASALEDEDQPFVLDTARRSLEELAPLIAVHAGIADADADLELSEALDTVTPLRPFLRWDPVPSPAIVPRRRFTEGESHRVLVVRSGVTQDPDTLAIKVTPPRAYAAAVHAAHPSFGYEAISERHLAPPKTSQSQAELHGMFDDAIGSTNPAAQKRMLGIALLENGSFLDLDIADIDDPPGRTVQDGVRLETQLGAPYADPISLPLLKPGDPPTPGRSDHLPPGQYVVHDTPDLVLPYLPDQLAAGVSFVFQEAGLDRAVPFPFGTEGFTARYGGRWPQIRPFRLELHGSPELFGRVVGRSIRIGLPPGDEQRFRLASSLRNQDLDLLGPWRSLPDPVRNDPNVAEAAADGWLWGLTPFQDVVLVHAVPRPIEAPRPTVLLPSRDEGATRVVLVGAVDVHGPSTGQLTAEASWTDPVDDLTLPRWEDRPTDGIAFSSLVKRYEDLAILGDRDVEGFVPGVGQLHSHAAVHELGDTKHRVITYRFRAATRFPEFFRPELLGSDPNIPRDDGRSVVGRSVEVSVPSSARPAAPIVHSVIPLFRWTKGEEAEQPLAYRHTRRAGVRVYLERPWFSSGAGELLGVLLAPGGDDTFGTEASDQSGFPFVSKWGSDPAWLSAPVDHRAMSVVQLDNLLRLFGMDDRDAPGRPVTAPRDLPLASLPGAPIVTVLGYRPRYDRSRRLWYVDVALDPGPTFWPFVRLSVCRYQPDSIDRCHLSPPIRCDFVQLTPERATSVSRTDARHVRVVVSGAIGVGREGVDLGGIERLADAVSANRQVVAKLERRDPDIPTNLGWRTVAVTELAIRGRSGAGNEVAWVGELDAATPVRFARPGRNEDWRVTVEEWELLAADPPSPAEAQLGPTGEPVWERRLVYADRVRL